MIFSFFHIWLASVEFRRERSSTWHVASNFLKLAYTVYKHSSDSMMLDNCVLYIMLRYTVIISAPMHTSLYIQHSCSDNHNQHSYRHTQTASIHAPIYAQKTLQLQACLQALPLQVTQSLSPSCSTGHCK